MACPPKGGCARIYPANGPHRGQYTFHCATLSPSIFLCPSFLLQFPLSLSFLSVFLFSFLHLPRQVPFSQFSLAYNDNGNENNRLWRVFPVSKPTKMTHKSDCLTKEALWINVSCASFDHLFRLLVDLSFFEGRGRRERMDIKWWKK